MYNKPPPKHQSKVKEKKYEMKWWNKCVRLKKGKILNVTKVYATPRKTRGKNKRWNIIIIKEII